MLTNELCRRIRLLRLSRRWRWRRRTSRWVRIREEEKMRLSRGRGIGLKGDQPGSGTAQSVIRLTGVEPKEGEGHPPDHQGVVHFLFEILRDEWHHLVAPPPSDCG